MAISKDFIAKNGIIIQGVGSPASTSTTTGALVVAGGVGIGGTVYASGSIYSGGSIVITQADIGAFVGGVSSIAGATGTVIINTGTNSGISVVSSVDKLTFTSTDTLSLVTSRGNSTPSAIEITNTATSTSTDSGALTVAGGVGVGGTVWATQLKQTGINVAIGRDAGQTNQGDNSIAIGELAGNFKQDYNAVAIGYQAGQYAQAGSTVAIGYTAGQGYTFEVDYVSGGFTSTTLVVADTAGITQGAIITGTGFGTGREVNQVINATTLLMYSVAESAPSGTLTVSKGQGYWAIAIGEGAGQYDQKGETVAIGVYAGYEGQGQASVAVGGSAGQTNQRNQGTAVGYGAGQENQRENAVAIGFQSGRNWQGTGTVAVGYQSGYYEQGSSTVAIGYQAGYSLQGKNAIAIGKNAGDFRQHTGSIIISALGTIINSVNTGTHIAPIRADASTSATQKVLYYNTSTKELTYSTAPDVSGQISVAITAHEAALDPHPQYQTAAETSATIAAHVAALDPHPQYQTSAETLVTVADVTKDIHGVVDRTASTISFDDANRRYTITPVSGSWTYYYKGVLHTVTTATSIVINNTSGARFIRMDPATETLIEGGPVPDFINDIVLSYIYFDATNGKALILGDERHGSQRDTTWHSSQHLNVGTIWRSGGGITYTLNSTSTIEIGVGTPLVIADEDLTHVIANSATPNGYYQQTLTGAASLEVLYLSSSTYVSTTATTTPWIAGTSLASYNQIVDGVGSLVDAGEGDYFTYWLIATNDVRSPVKLVLGRETFTTIDAAYAESFTDYGLSFAEQVFMYQIVVQTSAAFDNVPKIEIAAVRKILTKVATSGSAASASIHNGLTGRDDVDSHPIGAITDLQSTLDSKQDTLVAVNDTVSPTVFYPLFVSTSTGTISDIKTSSSKFTFIPETGQLTVIDLNSTSDLAYKEQVESITDAYSILEKINAVSFNWKATGRKSYGVIAQELQQILPELVTQGNEGLAVSYIPLIAILIQSIKEQNEKIRNLENKLDK